MFTSNHQHREHGDFDPTEEEASLNPSSERRFAEIVRSRVGRRTVLAGGLATAAGFLAAGPSRAGLLDGDGPLGLDLDLALGARKPLLGFTAIAPSQEDAVRVPAGYTATPIVPWGTPIVAPYPAFSPGTPGVVAAGGNGAADQAKQMGMDHDGMHFFPIGLGRNANLRGLLVLNHEAVDEKYLHTGTGAGQLPALPADAAWTLEMVRKSQSAHGVAVVELFFENGQWKVVRGRYNRRIHANTPMEFSGPARGHRLLRTSADPAGTSPVGTFNNCANGFTPWQTYLTCEENFNGFFRVEGTGFSPEIAGLQSRYGLGGDRNKWATNDPRFRVTATDPNEPNRFGWVVEIDPFDPDSTPVKRTALGRLKHENACTVLARDGRPVVYMGDDQANEYLYKFVGRRHWRIDTARRRSPLDEGTLYVAKFSDDGTGTWIPLVQGQGPLTAANGFADQGDVLVKTRLAGTAVGATPMDRPEWIAVNPRTGRAYVTCTNNTDAAKVVSGPNPRKPNAFGHIVCWEEKGGDHAATTFTWNLMAVAGAGNGTDGSTIRAEDAFGSPDGLWVDDDGRMFIETDGTQPVPCNNQMLVADLSTRPKAAPGSSNAVPEIRRFLTGPKGCEITGITATPDQKTLFVNIQHPGEAPNVSTWPGLDGITTPRSATVVITRNNGGVVGS